MSIALCFVLTALEVDGKPVSRGTGCSAVCGSAASLVCTVSNCTSSVLTDVTVEVLSVDLLSSCSASSLNSKASESLAVFDDSAVAVGCLMSVFPQVRLLNSLYCYIATSKLTQFKKN